MSNPESTGALISQMAGDPEMADLLQDFLAELSTRATALSQAWEARDGATIRFISHQMKGTAGLYGFPTITTAASLVEEGARDAQAIENLQTQVNELLVLCAQASAGLPAAPDSGT